MADDSNIKFDVELNEGSVDSAFKVVDDRAAKSAKESAAVFGEHFQKMENELKDSLDKINRESNKNSEKSAKESAAVFTEAFKTQDMIYKASVKQNLDNAINAIMGTEKIKKSARDSAAVFEEAFQSGLLKGDPIDLPLQIPPSLFSIKGPADLAGAFYLLKEAADVAAKAMQAAIDVVVDGEANIKIDQKFRVLAEQAGIAAEVIRTELTDSAKGFVGSSELLGLASQSFVQLGNNAKALPQILELARKAYNVFGGDVVQNVETISNAIFSGQTRQIRQLGLLINTEQIYKNYAKAIGTVVPLLTEQQRQTAILNEVLKQGEERFKNITAESGKVTDATKRYTTQIGELKSEFASFVSGLVGNTLAKFIDSGTESLKAWTRIFSQSRIDSMPEGVDKINFAIRTLSESISEGEKRLSSFNKTEMRTLGEGLQSGIEAKKVQLASYVKQLEEAQSKVAGFKSSAGPSGTSVAPEDSAQAAEYIRRKQDLVNKVKELNTQLDASNVQAAQADFNRVKNIQNLEALTYQQRLQANEQFNLQSAQLEKFYTENGVNDKVLKDQGREALEAQHLARLAEIQTNYNEYTTSSAYSTGDAFADIMKGMDEAAQEMTLNASRNFKNLGKTMLQGIGQAAGNAFAAFGRAVAEGENALDAFGKALLNSLGQMAIQVGTMFILQGIGYTYAGMANGPPLIAAGAALAAFGGFLSAVSGVGPKDSGGGGISSGLGGGATNVSPVLDRTAQEETQAAIPQTAINLTINGNVLDRRQTGLEIAQILEEQFADQGLSIRGA